ncbi:MAG: transporter substrate-binding domain-containing protein [Synergistaceae bacterium]|nr:transporter substrate-binding domain-containing protein [Synergistaceae bacterium]
MKGCLAALLCLCCLFAVPASAQTVRVGTESTYPPYEFRDASGALVGFDIDLVKLLADRLDWKIRWVEMPFDALIPALEEGEIDLIAACLSCTPERAARVAFSDPYEITPSTFVVGDGFFPTGPASLKGKVVAVQPGTAEDRYIRDLGTPLRAPYDRLDEAFAALAAGTVDAVFVDDPVARSYIKNWKDPNTFRRAFSLKLVGAEKALAVKKSAGDFIDDINRVLLLLREDGSLAELERRWKR